jgi:biotin carboxylase
VTSALPLLHVIGAGPWQLATIRRAQQLGCRVLVTDGMAGRPGFAVADLHAVADITDPEATLAVARRHGVAGVLCDTTDNGVLAAAHVAAELGLPGVGWAAALNCTDKARMTACAADAGLRVPFSASVHSPQAALSAARGSGPWVIKPVDNQSGRGVTVVRSRGELPAAVSAAFANSRQQRVLVQDFVSGAEIIVDSLVVEGVVHRLGLACKTPYADNPTISSRITYGTEQLSPEVLAKVDHCNRRLLQALGIQQGLVHAEYLLAGQDVVPIDVAARGGGVHIYPLVLPHVSGVDAMRCAIDLAMGRRVNMEPWAPGRAANIEFLRCKPGVIQSIDGVAEAEQLQGVARVQLNRQIGERVGGLLDKDQRLGHVVTLANSVEDAVQVGARAAQLIQVQLA